MSEQDLLPFVGRLIVIKSRKLMIPVTGTIRAIVAGVLMVQGQDGFYGIRPMDVLEVRHG